MLKLIRANFYRLWRMKSFYICTAVVAGLTILGVIITQVQYNAYNSSTEPTLKIMAENEHSIMKAGGVGYLGTCMGDITVLMMLAIIVSIFICVDFNTGAIKNTHGFSRNEIYFSTLITSAAASLIMMLAYMLISFVSASIAWGVGKVDSHIIASLFKMIGMESLLIIGIAALFVMVAMVMRNSGGTIAVNMSSLIAVPIILSLVNRLFSSDVVLTKYWLGTSIMNMATLKPANDDIIRCLIVAGCYIVISTLIGVVTFQKRDIK